MKAFYSVLTVFFVVIAINSKANDTLFKLAQPLATAHQWSYRGGNTSLDGTLWRTLGYTETGWATGQNAPLGFGTGTPARNTTIAKDGSANSGGTTTPNACYPTMYFRKIVNIPNPSAYINFQIRTKLDDAIVVWINGAEAYRNNIATSPVLFSHLSAATGDNGAGIKTGTINTALFNPGNNIIAVEIHQTTLTSSDLFFDMELIGVNDVAISRGPYLNMGGQTGITIRWRTDVATNSRVTYGTTLGTYTNTTDDATVTTEHIVNLSGLSPDTKYFYTIGSTAGVLQSGAPNYFVTVPPATTNRKIRIAAFGDCGFLSTNQTFTRQAYMNFLAARGITEIDGLIMMGDNVYETGTDAEWQTEFFQPYQDVFLKNWKLYPAPGNHDYGNTNSQAETNNRDNNYYRNFTLPTGNELGGEPSGTEAFYSFNIGDIHFLSLDSYGRETASTNSKMYDTLTPQAVWVKNDLAANTKKWVVAFWHHAPYTKIGLNSDNPGELTNVRENFIRILERFGVDLVICGHSHGYERSYLLKNYYKANPGDPALLDANFRKNLHTADSSSALYDGTSALTCAYSYNSGKYNHGTVYAVSGSSGKNDQVAQGGYPHDAMYFSQLQKGGAMYFEVDSNRLDAKYIWQNGNSTPLVGDSFTVFKDVKKFTTYTVPRNSILNIQSSWKGSYNWFTGGTTSPNLSAGRSFTVPTNVAGTFRYVVKDFSNNTCLKDSFEVVVSGTLPVLLASFTASLQNNKVVLDWATSMEQNNKYFTVEKSTDGINFNFLAKVNGAENSSTPKSYRAYDYTPVKGSNYYRLSQTNIDDRTTFFDIKMVSYKSNNSFTAGITNLSYGINVSINTIKNDQFSIRIFDETGREVIKESFTGNAGSTRKNYSLKNGVYIVRLSNSSNETVTNKIIIK